MQLTLYVYLYVIYVIHYIFYILYTHTHAHAHTSWAPKGNKKWCKDVKKKMTSALATTRKSRLKKIENVSKCLLLKRQKKAWALEAPVLSQ